MSDLLCVWNKLSLVCPICNYMTVVEQFSIECRKTSSKFKITLANHDRPKQHNKQIHVYPMLLVLPLIN